MCNLSIYTVHIFDNIVYDGCGTRLVSRYFRLIMTQCFSWKGQVGQLSHTFRQWSNIEIQWAIMVQIWHLLSNGTCYDEIVQFLPNSVPQNNDDIYFCFY